MQTKSMVQVSLFTALLCVLAPLSLPVGPIPLSLATLAVYLAAGMLGAKKGCVAVLVYILLGAVGLPVFSGFRGGLAVVTGVTGGYILGYLPCALLAGLHAGHTTSKWAFPLGLAAGTAALYTVGTAWFMAQTGSGFGAALSLCVLPFLAGDLLKIAAAAILCPRLRQHAARPI